MLSGAVIALHHPRSELLCICVAGPTSLNLTVGGRVAVRVGNNPESQKNGCWLPQFLLVFKTQDFSLKFWPADCWNGEYYTGSSIINQMCMRVHWMFHLYSYVHSWKLMQYIDQFFNDFSHVLPCKIYIDTLSHISWFLFIYCFLFYRIPKLTFGRSK